jgi:hypothetical protein
MLLLSLVLPLRAFAGPWFLFLLLLALACAASIPYFSAKSTAVHEAEARSVQA